MTSVTWTINSKFLQHILDATRMEELDILKKRKPPWPKESRKRSGKKRTPAPSTFNSSTAGRSPTSTLPESEQLKSFCKKVSLTYEDFNDLSLSIKPEDYVKDRRRYRFKQFARKSARLSGDRLGQRGRAPTNEGPRRRSIDLVGEQDETTDAVTVGQQSPIAEEGDATPANFDDRNEQNAELIWTTSESGRARHEGAGQRQEGDAPFEAGGADAEAYILTVPVCCIGRNFCDSRHDPLAHPHKSRPTIVGERKKSIPAPKPSAEQAAYLRHLLADVHAPNGNRLAVLQHTIAGSTHYRVHGPEVEYDANGEAWDDSYESDSDISISTVSSIASPTASPSSRRASLEDLRKPVVRPAKGPTRFPVTKVARLK
ncbi:uncharacterized protein LAESUDRAFT_765268 [Laetiporus sulphureus 93-53]|uniref:Uncharacterized protein n=1 Tax=Laetiporus sulphureus 93-53 TaxID=1314785 RepID=A0A165AUM5_9APHY|nr:uncharacterized protein LAESUDRAFT_765268 [Laetiporus sulphureus 93-53]KZS99692.1 hypothetical protein LAESUDRAFT_765268 [Laetiporus sulphureus 93-53]